MGVWPRPSLGLSRPLLTRELVSIFPALRVASPLVLPALPSMVPRCEAADWVRAEVRGPGQCLSSKPTFIVPLSAETELRAKWKQ